MRALAFTAAAIVATVSANPGWSNMYYQGHAYAQNDSPEPNPAPKEQAKPAQPKAALKKEK